MKIVTREVKYIDYEDRAYCKCGGEFKGSGLGVSQGWDTKWKNKCTKCYKEEYFEYTYPRYYQIEKKVKKK